MKTPITYSGPSSKPHDTGVAAAIVIARKGKILLMKRKGSAGEGTWAIPGGSVNYFESPEDAVIRETLEETGLKIKNPQFIGYTNDILEHDSLHFITMRFFVDDYNGVEKIMEPDKCSAMGWFNIDNLPEPMFKPTQDIVSNIKIIKLVEKTKK